MELAKDWRTDRMLREGSRHFSQSLTEGKLTDHLGNGDVIQPEDDLIAIGSGGPYAQSAARALLDNTDLSAKEIVENGLKIAGDICVYTNHTTTIEELNHEA